MDYFLGEIRMFCGTWAPADWALCDGSILSIADYSTLYALIGTTYGGDGNTTFALPDLRGRVPVHAAGGSVIPGQMSGTETVSLVASNYPAHTHTINVTNTESNTTTPTGGILAMVKGTGEMYAGGPTPAALDATTMGPSTNPGSAMPHENMQPFTVINFIIATAGIWPSQS